MLAVAMAATAMERNPDEIFMVRTPQCRRFAGRGVGSKLQLNNLARDLVPGPVTWFQACSNPAAGRPGEGRGVAEGGKAHGRSYRLVG